MTATKGSLKNKVYDIVKKKIIDCSFMPGSVINEQLLIEETGVSRTPIREALNRMEQEGYVKILPKVGVIVSPISYNDVCQVFYVRGLLEPAVLVEHGHKLDNAKLLDFRKRLIDSEGSREVEDYTLDVDMHRYLFSVCENHYLITLLNKVLDQNTRVIIIASDNGARMHDSKCEHIDILDAVLREDYNVASQLMKAHLSNCREASLEYYTKYYVPVAM